MACAVCFYDFLWYSLRLQLACRCTIFNCCVWLLFFVGFSLDEDCTAILAGGIAVVSDVEVGEEVIYFVLWRLDYQARQRVEQKKTTFG